MRPELFSIPFIHLSIKGYGTMMVLGFVAAVLLARRRSRKLGENPNHITDFGVYALLAGLVGARLMYVVHNLADFRGNLKEVFAVWSGGLEFLGGFVLAVVVFLIYFGRKRLPMLKYLDILAPAVMLGLAFGRIGCLLNGCCFGAVTDLPWGIRFPAVTSHTERAAGCEKATRLQYGHAYEYQLHCDPERGIYEPIIDDLPDGFYDGYTDGDGHWASTKPEVATSEKYYRFCKPIGQLTDEQKAELKSGMHPMHAVHPAQAYSAVNALFWCVVLEMLFAVRRRNGQIFAVMLVGYGATRFGLETLRTEPLSWFGLTVSENLGIAAVVAGVVMLLAIRRSGQGLRADEQAGRTK